MSQHQPTIPLDRNHQHPLITLRGCLADIVVMRKIISSLCSHTDLGYPILILHIVTFISRVGSSIAKRMYLPFLFTFKTLELSRGPKLHCYLLEKLLYHLKTL